MSHKDCSCPSCLEQVDYLAHTWCNRSWHKIQNNSWTELKTAPNLFYKNLFYIWIIWLKILWLLFLKLFSPCVLATYEIELSINRSLRLLLYRYDHNYYSYHYQFLFKYHFKKIFRLQFLTMLRNNLRIIIWGWN